MSAKARMVVMSEASAGRSIDDYPIRLFAHHMAEIFSVSLKRFYALESDGSFRWAQNVPQIGRKSWSRDRVKAHFAGDTERLARQLGVVRPKKAS